MDGKLIIYGTFIFLIFLFCNFAGQLFILRKKNHAILIIVSVIETIIMMILILIGYRSA
ncbi:putative membrane protein [Scopulibacillus daqui]|uniref:Membrane protein n=1 Tax=Scopulibacillus daqui TaxID=1469162 RepID=A0ABS2Q125_9BACL|nr:hypothetical protein [Scopulibacillus daqui]MBM7645992.1 putative membrane protein [Scopulibacillus daqui]